MKSMRSRQHGITLLVSLIMLIVLTLFAVTSFRLGKGNLQIVSNMQQRNQALSAAQGAIERVVSGIQFMSTPNVPSTTFASVNGSGTNDISVVSTPICISAQPIPGAALNFSDPDDAGCLIGASQQFGVAGVSTSNFSLCSNALWDIQAVATDTLSRAQFRVNQGVYVRVAATDPCLP